MAAEGDKSSYIRQPGAVSPPRRPPRLNRNAKIAMRRLVQCIEVDEKLNALKINDEETAVWCFVTAPAMKNVSEQTLACVSRHEIQIQQYLCRIQ